MYRVGYIDEDKGWLNTFYQNFKSEFDVKLFEVNEETELDTLVTQIFDSAIDILVLDFRLDETGLVDFNADQIMDKIQERNLYYPLIVLTSHETDALDHLSDAHVVNGKDLLDMGDEKLLILKHKVSKIAGDYKKKIAEAEIELKTLEEKRFKGGLLPNEEDRYVQLNSFLDKTIVAKGHLSRSFYSVDTNKRLDDLIEKTESLLRKLDDKSE